MTPGTDNVTEPERISRVHDLRVAVHGAVIAALVVVVVVLGAANRAGVSVHYVVGTRHRVPVYLIIGIAVLVGILIGGSLRLTRHAHH